MRFRYLSGADGSALATVTILIVILSAIAGSVLAISVLQVRFFRQSVHQVQARYAAEAGIAHALRDLGRGSGMAEDISLPVSETSRAQVRSGTYGAFAYIAARGFSMNQSVLLHATALLVPGHHFEHAIWIGDASSGLVMTGSAEIRGSVVTGQAGLQTASLRAESFTGRRPDVVVASDTVEVPYYDPSSLWSAVHHLNRTIAHPPDSLKIPGRRVIPVVRVDRAGVGVHGDHAAAFVGDGSMRITGQSVIAPGSVVMSGGSVVIDEDVVGRDLIVYARDTLSIGGSTMLSGQFIAGRTITLSESVHLAYPSVVVLHGYADDQEDPPTVWLDGESRIDGMVIIPPGDGAEARLKRDDVRKVVVGPGAMVRGAIFSDARTEVRGSIHGSIITRRFHFHVSPSHYINWIRDADVRHEARPESFGVAVGFEGRRFRLSSVYVARHEVVD